MEASPTTATGPAVERLSELLARRNAERIRLAEVELEIETTLAAAAICVAQCQGATATLKQAPFTRRLALRIAELHRGAAD